MEMLALLPMLLADHNVNQFVDFLAHYGWWVILAIIVLVGLIKD